MLESFRRVSGDLVHGYIYLVGGIPTPLKNMSLSVGMMTFPTEWKVIKIRFQTTNQLFYVVFDGSVNKTWELPATDGKPGS